jgi:hypothetical protein
MKRAAIIISAAFLFSCNGDKSGSQENVLDAAKDKAGEMSNGATDAATTAEAGHKKYEIKSGIITTETVMSMNGMNLTSKKVLYFDDYGAKECEEEFKTDDAGKEFLAMRIFVKDGFHYTCSVENKGGVKTKSSGYGVASPFNMSEASTQTDSQYKVLSETTVCGKSCKGFSMVTPSGNISMYGWNGITLKTVVDNASMDLKTSTTATKIEENVAIPAEKFEVPAGVVMQTM